MKGRTIIFIFPVLPLLILLSLSIGYFTIASATTIHLSKTGQTKCYDANGNLIACAGTGQDGEIQAGVAWPSPRFTVNGACIMDKLTGLMWARNGNLPTVEVTWIQALNYVALINGGRGLCGYNDWRLPNVNEIESLGNLGVADSSGWLNIQGFINVQAGYIWSSTTNSESPSVAKILLAWANGLMLNPKNVDDFMLMVRGGQLNTADPSYPGNLPKTGQTKCYDANGNLIACAGTGQDGEIQAGVAWPSPRFTDTGRETVTDSLTGLMWLKDANCMSTNYPLLGGAVLWQQALDFVKGINDGTYPKCGNGYHDWRLPNRKELRSLFCDSNYNPALPAGHPFSNVYSVNWVWTATTSAYYPGSAYFVDMSTGSSLYVEKSSYNCYVWPVRSGLSYEYLNISIVGDGGGTVNSSPSGINCVANCAATFPLDSFVFLFALPDAGSIFEGWSGDGDCDAGNVTVDTAKWCTATFTICGSQPVRIGESAYDSIYDAYSAASPSEPVVIKITASNEIENLNFGLAKNVQLSGGYNCSFANQVSYSTITGTVIISGGTIEVEKIVIR